MGVELKDDKPLTVTVTVLELDDEAADDLETVTHVLLVALTVGGNVCDVDAASVGLLEDERHPDPVRLGVCEPVMDCELDPVVLREDEAHDDDCSDELTDTESEYDAVGDDDLDGNPLRVTLAELEGEGHPDGENE